jgi:hypothetical protein
VISIPSGFNGTVTRFYSAESNLCSVATPWHIKESLCGAMAVNNKTLVSSIIQIFIRLACKVNSFIFSVQRALRRIRWKVDTFPTDLLVHGTI